MKLSFSLNKPKQAPPKPSIRPSAVFSAEDHDDRIDAAPTSAFADSNTAGNKKLSAHGIESSRDKRKRAEAEKIEEVYDYDGAWDRIQAERQRQKEMKESESKERKVSSVTCSKPLPLPSSLLAKVYSWSFILSCNAEVRSPACGRKDDPT